VIAARRAFPFVFAATIAALGWQTLRVRDRIEAGRILALVEARTVAALRARRAPPAVFEAHLAWLDRAGRLDPLEIGIPIARGTQFLLLRRPDDAVAAYRAAAALEARPEIDLNLGRALWAGGNRGEAREAFARAVRLNPMLRAEIPAGGLDGTR
jgi:tetratricopeptide (TPR) repeat protein